MKKQNIKVTDAWFDELLKMPFVSRKLMISWWFTVWFAIEKNGKTLNLLKASAKKINPHKKKKIIPLLGNIKEFHIAA